MKEFYATKKIVKTINQTFIVLIPKKKKDAVSFEDFYPISLCNFCYKVISKLLVNRIRLVLSQIISPFQSAFVPGRWFAENTILAHEVVNTIKKKRKGKGALLGLKIDMNKAYDRLE